MDVRAITVAEAQDFDALARERGTVFNSIGWTELFGERLTRYGIFQNGTEMVGGFCLYRQSRFGLSVVGNAPFTPQCGPFFKTKAQTPVALLEDSREILDAVADFLDKRSYPCLSMCLDPRVQDALPFVWRSFTVVPRYTYVLDLSASPDDLLSNMSSVRRRNISKAGRDGLVVRKTTDLEVVQGFVRETFTRNEVRASAQTLDAVLFRFANEGNSYAFITYRGNSAIACCFVVHDDKTAYYLLGGFKADEKHHGAGALALFEAIKHAKTLGLKAFDFEGSMIPAVERYFRGFGGRLTPYFTVNKAWLPLEILLKVFKRGRF